MSAPTATIETERWACFARLIAPQRIRSSLAIPQLNFMVAPVNQALDFLSPGKDPPFQLVGHVIVFALVEPF